MLCVEMGRQYWEALELKVWLWREDTGNPGSATSAGSASDPHTPGLLPSKLHTPLLDEALIQSGYNYAPLQMRKPSPKRATDGPATDSITIVQFS